MRFTNNGYQNCNDMHRTTKEIADILNIGISTVNNRINHLGIKHSYKEVTTRYYNLTAFRQIMDYSVPFKPVFIEQTFYIYESKMNN